MKHPLISAMLASCLLASAVYFAQAASVLVQQATAQVSSGTLLTLNFPTTVTPGDEITVFAACAQRSNALSVSGLGGAVWQLVESDSAPNNPNSPVADMWLAAAPAEAGATITITASIADNCAAHAAEWAGTTGVKDTGDAVDRNSASFGTYGSPETTVASDLLVTDVAWKGSATVTGAPEGTTGPLRLYIPMTSTYPGSALNIQPYYFLTWDTGSFPAVNGAFSASADWTVLQVALQSAGSNPTPTPAAPCAGPIPSAVAPYACSSWGPSQW